MTGLDTSTWGTDAELLRRQGACLVVDPAAGIADLSELLTANLFGWARDPELYALVVDARRLDAMAPMSSAQWRLVAEALWRLDCFSKPTVTLLAADAGPVAIAFGLVGTHRVLPPDGTVSLHAGRTLDLLPPLIRTAARSATASVLLDAGTRLDAVTALAMGFVSHTVSPAAMERIIAGLADANPVDPLLDAAQVAPMATGNLDRARTPTQSNDATAALAAGRAGDLRAVTLALDGLRHGNQPWLLPTRIELQSLRGR